MSDPSSPSRRVLPLAFAAAVLLALPALPSPLFQDDVIHRAMVLDRVAGLRWGPLALYDFVGSPERPAVKLRETGAVPWFTAEDLVLRFFRPLTSATLALDVRVFGERAWAARVHSLSWFLAILTLVAALHQRFLPRTDAVVATAIYALAGGHAMPIAWIAARHALVTTALAMLSFWLHVRWREDGWKPGAWLAPMAFATGLFAGEMALGAAALIAAWELLGRRDAIRRRLTGIAPFASLSAVYAVFYTASGYGAKGSGAYLDLRDAGGTAAAAARHFMILASELIAATPSDAAALASPATQGLVALWGAIVAAAAWLLFRLVRARASGDEIVAARWMAAAAAGAALPGSLGLFGGRVLTLALFPASAVVAILIVRGLGAVRDRSVRPIGRIFAGVTIAGLALGHFATGPAMRILVGALFAQVARVQEQQADWTPACPGVMVIVAASDPTISTYVPANLTLRGRAPERLRVLSTAAYDHRIENVTRTGFDLAIPDASRVRSVWERLYRSAPLPASTHVTITSLDAAVIEDRDGAPTRVRFDFGEPLDSPRLCFLQWRGGRLTRLAPPKPGDRIDLPREPGPTGW